MKLYTLGACREVGKSAFMVKTDRNIMLDYGVKIRCKGEKEYLPHPHNCKLDVAVITHAHLDHSGGLPYLYEGGGRPTTIGTPPTKDLVDLLLQDSIKIVGIDDLPYGIKAYANSMRNFHTLDFGKVFNTGETSLKMLNAGHITGGAQVEIVHKGKKLVYTGDFNDIDSQLHNRCTVPEGDVHTLVVESTYATKDHHPRRQTERELYDEIMEIIEAGGNAIIPAFGVDRTHEILRVIRKFDKDVEIWIDGMGRKAMEIMRKHPDFVRDAHGLNKDWESANIITYWKQRAEPLTEPSVIITTAGMLSGGPVMQYLMSANPNSKVLFTGYCVEETNGWNLQNKGYIMDDGEQLTIDLKHKYFDFSGHIGQKGLIDYIKKVNPEKIFTVHGDECEAFAANLVGEGFDAIAPEEGQEFELF